MKKFEEKSFTLPTGQAGIGELKGISAKNIAEHLKLYSGYVKNLNNIIEKIEVFNKDKENNIYFLGELYRRFSFEYNGMKNHEIYFESLSDGPREINMESILYKKIVENFGSFAEFLEDFKTLALTRGIGWAALWYNSERDILMSSWIDEQHLGQLNNTTMILGIDMWEHAYVYDYPTSEKKNYIEAFFANLNWEKIENNLKNVLK